MGDSLGRQQYQSFLCLVEPDGNQPLRKVDLGKEFGFYQPKGGRRPNGDATLFLDYNITVAFYSAEVLCRTEWIRKEFDKGYKTMRDKFALHVDRVDPKLNQLLLRSDMLLLNSQHHWNGSENWFPF